MAGGGPERLTEVEMLTLVALLRRFGDGHGSVRELELSETVRREAFVSMTREPLPPARAEFYDDLGAVVVDS